MNGRRKLSFLVLLAVMIGMLVLPVTANAKTVKLSKNNPKASVKIQKNNNVTIKVVGIKKGTKVTWTSSNKTVATVSKNTTKASAKKSTSIKVSGKANGEAVIRAKFKVGKKTKTWKCTVKVLEEKDYATVVDMNNLGSEVYMSVDETRLFRATSTGTLQWISSDETVASVKDGLVTALKPGETYITAQDDDNPGVKDTVLVIVKKETELEDVVGPNVRSGREEFTFEFKAVPWIQYYAGIYVPYNADGTVVDDVISETDEKGKETGKFYYRNEEGEKIYVSLKLSHWDNDKDKYVPGETKKFLVSDYLDRENSFGIDYYAVPSEKSLKKYNPNTSKIFGIEVEFKTVPKTVATICADPFVAPKLGDGVSYGTGTFVPADGHIFEDVQLLKKEFLNGKEVIDDGYDKVSPSAWAIKTVLEYPVNDGETLKMAGKMARWMGDWDISIKLGDDASSLICKMEYMPDVNSFSVTHGDGTLYS